MCTSIFFVQFYIVKTFTIVLKSEENVNSKGDGSQSQKVA